MLLVKVGGGMGRFMLGGGGAPGGMLLFIIPGFMGFIPACCGGRGIFCGGGPP